MNPNLYPEDDEEDDADGQETRAIPLSRFAPRPETTVPTASPQRAPTPAAVTAPVTTPATPPVTTTAAPPVATPPVVTTPTPAASPAAPPAPSPTRRIGKYRAAEALKTTPPTTTQIYKILRASGLSVHQYRFSPQCTLAEAAANLIGRLIPVRLDCDGRLLGWYRLGLANGPLPADTRMESVSADEPLYLHFVESRLIPLWVEVQDGPRLRMQVSSAMPMSSLVDGLATMLDLPSGDYQAVLEGIVLGPYHILEDRNPAADARLVVRRA